MFWWYKIISILLTSAFVNVTLCMSKLYQINSILLTGCFLSFHVADSSIDCGDGIVQLHLWTICVDECIINSLSFCAVTVLVFPFYYGNFCHAVPLGDTVPWWCSMQSFGRSMNRCNIRLAMKGLSGRRCEMAKHLSRTWHRQWLTCLTV
jgi:hypothetical protein